MYEDWLIENNVVITDHWHGVSLYGAKNCKIINNTVIDPNNNDPGPPWIRITAHKDGRKSTDNIIRNNLTTSLSNDADIGEVDHNFSIRFNSYESYFVNVDSFDVSLKESARAIDRGSEDSAPSIDIIGTPRPQGEGYDLGAFEYIESTDVLNYPSQHPTTFQVKAFPNPFNPYSTIEYALPSSGRVNISVFNLRGEIVSQLLDEFQHAGEHRVRFRGDKLPSGIYFCKIRSKEFNQTFAMVLSK
jgi:parallel beta-helix repeat protein